MNGYTSDESELDLQDTVLDSEDDCQNNSKIPKEIYNHPWFKFRKMKSDIIQKVGNLKRWGTYGSDERVFAISDLCSFLKYISSIDDEITACNYPEMCQEELSSLKAKVKFESFCLVTNKILPLPQKLFEDIVEALAENRKYISSDRWDTDLKTIIQVLNRKRESAILARNYQDGAYFAKKSLGCGMFSEFFSPDGVFLDTQTLYETEDDIQEIYDYESETSTEFERSDDEYFDHASKSQAKVKNYSSDKIGKLRKEI